MPHVLATTRAWLERRGWWKYIAWLYDFGRREIVLLLVALVVIVVADQFMELADEVSEGETQTFDERAVRFFRRADDPSLPIGPAWLREVGIDLTALGSIVVLALVSGCVAGFLMLQRKRRYALLVTVSLLGGIAINSIMKRGFDRDRPTVVPHLREVMTPSFPSGHAMLSAVVYLTLGVLLMEVARGRLTKLYCVLVAMLLTFLVGASRVYLGVHYPTDVLGGWATGLVWALLCWSVAHLLGRYGKLREKRPPPDEAERDAQPLQPGDDAGGGADAASVISSPYDVEMRSPG